MSHAWKPGDVALVRNRFNVWNRAICSVSRDGLMWRYGVADDEDPVEVMQGVRALVVIDPEDREEVERFVRIYSGQPNGPFTTDVADDIQSALREYVYPTTHPTCGAIVSLDYGTEAWQHKCEGLAGHDGPHSDAALTWSAVTP